MKTCSKCKQRKDPSEFHKKSTSKDGLQSSCRSCMKKWQEENRDKTRAASQKWKKSNSEKTREISRNWKKSNPERNEEITRGWREENQDRIRQYSLRWKRENPEKHRAAEAKRRAAKLQRTPPWADLEAITEVYVNCPDGYHVDHIVPLQGKTVSGLHISRNLQYLPAEENLQKGNRL